MGGLHNYLQTKEDSHGGIMPTKDKYFDNWHRLPSEGCCCHCGIGFEKRNGGGGYYELKTFEFNQNYRNIHRRYCSRCAIHIIDIIKALDCYMVKDWIKANNAD